MRTLSVSRATGTSDLDGRVVDGLDSLRQRVEQALQLRLGEWVINRQRGVPRDLLVGQATTLDIAGATIVSAIREEGGAEVTAVRDVTATLDHATRIMRFSATVDSIYGPMPITEDLQT